MSAAQALVQSTDRTISHEETKLYLPFANKYVSDTPELLEILGQYPWEPVSRLNHGGGKVDDNPPALDPSPPSQIEVLAEAGESPSTGPRSGTRHTPIHALVIGINNYRKFPLSGAALDAESFAEYLRAHLHVPTDQIDVLLDGRATRAGIIVAFQSLSNNKKIHKDDAIIIYYAGHGASVPPPPGWEAGGPDVKIQSIVPQDFSETVHVIPDYTLGFFINAIAREKGNNIAVILDTCYSGSGTRGFYTAPRTIKIDTPLPVGLDYNICEEQQNPVERGGIAALGYEKAGLSSHVLIAACGPNESAQESSIVTNGGTIWRGNFTVALLNLLQGEGANKLTYADIRRRIARLDRQNPQIEGDNCKRFIFSTKESQQGAIYDVAFVKFGLNKGKYKVNAGIAHAVSPGAQFTVYKDRNAFDAVHPLGILQVSTGSDIRSISTFLSPLSGSTPFKLDQPGIAIQTKDGDGIDLRVYVALKTDNLRIFYAVLKEREKTGTNRYNMEVFSKSKANTHLELKIVDNAVSVDVLDGRSTMHLFSHLLEQIKPDIGHIHSFLRKAAHYYRYFDLEAPSTRYFPSGIKLEFYGLYVETAADDAETFTSTPITKNLVKDGVVDIVIDPDIRYGVKITNSTPWGLYVYAFRFENSNFRIDKWSLAASSGDQEAVNPSVITGGTLTLGYGAGGASPQIFWLRGKRDLDLSFFKFFFSTKPIDLTAIPQSSVFEREGRGDDSSPVVETLGTIVLPIIQRRTEKPKYVQT